MNASVKDYEEIMTVITTYLKGGNKKQCCNETRFSSERYC